MTCATTPIVRIDPMAGAAYLAQMQAILAQWEGGVPQIEFAVLPDGKLVWRFQGQEAWNEAGDLPGGSGEPLPADYGVFGYRFRGDSPIEPEPEPGAVWLATYSDDDDDSLTIVFQGAVEA